MPQPPSDTPRSEPSSEDLVPSDVTVGSIPDLEPEQGAALARRLLRSKDQVLHSAVRQVCRASAALEMASESAGICDDGDVRGLRMRRYRFFLARLLLSGGERLPGLLNLVQAELSPAAVEELIRALELVKLPPEAVTVSAVDILGHVSADRRERLHMALRGIAAAALGPILSALVNLSDLEHVLGTSGKADVIQRTLLIIGRRCAAPYGLDSVVAYARRVARGLACAMARGRSQQRTRDRIFQEELEYARGGHAELGYAGELDAAKARLDYAICRLDADLTEAERTVVGWWLVENLSYAEIAAEKGVTAKAARKRMQRARGKAEAVLPELVADDDETRRTTTKGPRQRAADALLVATVAPQGSGETVRDPRKDAE